MCYFLWLILIIPSALLASPESCCRRVQAHLLIGDVTNAVYEAEIGIKQYPQEPRIYEMALKSLACAGKDGELMKLWDRFYRAFPEAAYKRELLEEMCWGILQKGQKAPSTSSQLVSTIGAALTQDMRAVRFLREGMRHSNAQIRMVAVQLGTLYRDQPLCEEIERLFWEEKVLEVRLEVINAIGQLKIDSLLPQLIAIVSDPKKGSREQLAAIRAIVNMREEVEREELEILATSKRAGLRQLVCEVIIYCDLKEAIDLIIPLIQDPHSEVRASALRALGVLRVDSFQGKSIVEYVRPLALKEHDPHVGITASWVWLLNEPETGQRGLIRWLEHGNNEVRAEAAAAVAASGCYGVALAHKLLAKTYDPYVKGNLALALIGQREECEEACGVLATLLQTHNEKWMMAEKGLFHVLQKSSIAHNPAIPNFPEVVNQTIRLELLNLLAVLEYPDVQDSIKTFLKQRRWKVTRFAAETLLGEGDEVAIDLVRELLDDPDKEIRFEAALVLATWGRDSSALPVLLQVYPDAGRQLRIKILEALGSLGDKEAIPFLVERLKEHSLMIRMIAASVLIQTLSH